MSRRHRDSDDSLDLTSSKFDAHKALYSRNVPLPSPSAPTLDNITKFVETSEGISIKPTVRRKVDTNVSKQEGQASTSSPRFQPHQEPIPGKPRRNPCNVLTRMANIEGPLSMLQRCMNQRIRIKVLTRNMAAIRGHCLGYLVAFDKHFNMALEDVTEVWTRRKNIKAPPLGSLGLSDQSKLEDVPWPKVRVISSTAKTEVCERYVSQLLLRGEHVAVVIAAGL